MRDGTLRLQGMLFFGDRAAHIQALLPIVQQALEVADKEDIEVINYYNQLSVAPGASEDEIRQAITNESRRWLNRTNAPDLRRRQEAERMVQMLEEAEKVLLNQHRRGQYDKELRTSPKAAQKMDEEALGKQKDLVLEGWKLLIEGNVPDALYVATRATEVAPANAEAWALLAQAKYRWGDSDDAVHEYKRAIQLRPNDASFYCDLGAVYESAGRTGEAMQQYERAARIEPTVPMYRAAMGILHVREARYAEGCPILEKCVQEEPDNATYRDFLALAYCERSYENWTLVEGVELLAPGYYATEKAHVDEALDYVDKAERLNARDTEISERVAEVRKNVEQMLKQRFEGRKALVAFGVLFGAIGLFGGDNTGRGANISMGLIWLACTGIYVWATMVPQYVLNRRIIGRKGLSSELSVQEQGFVAYGITSLLMAFFLPIIALYCTVKNRVFTK